MTINYTHATPARIKGHNSRIQMNDVFEITNYKSNNDREEGTFDIVVHGIHNFCLVKGCAHLGGGDWTLLEGLVDENGEEYEDE